MVRIFTYRNKVYIKYLRRLHPGMMSCSPEVCHLKRDGICGEYHCRSMEGEVGTNEDYCFYQELKRKI